MSLRRGLYHELRQPLLLHPSRQLPLRLPRACSCRPSSSSAPLERRPPRPRLGTRSGPSSAPSSASVASTSTSTPLRHAHPAARHLSTSTSARARETGSDVAPPAGGTGVGVGLGAGVGRGSGFGLRPPAGAEASRKATWNARVEGGEGEGGRGRGGVRGRDVQRNVVDELERRGFVAAMTSPQLRTHVENHTTIYSGVDPSASSLHVGNLLPLLALLHFHVRGHDTIALIGGATGSIGDPSGRSTERSALSPAELQHNVRGITAQVERFFANGAEYVERRGLGLHEHGHGQAHAGASDGTGTGTVSVVNNLDWTGGVSLIDFLRDVGKMARVNVMLARDSVKSRLDSSAGISFTEFTYQLLQAHDFAHLYRARGCTVQLGGSDQWGNIVAGIDLVRRELAARRAVQEAEAAAMGGNKGKKEKNKSKGAVKAEAKAKAQAEAEAEAMAKVQAQRADGTEAGSESFEGGVAGQQPAAQAQAQDSIPTHGKEKETDSDPVYGLTIPLLTTSTGEKFGKSAGNAVWLDEARTSVMEFYQDADVERYLRLFTLLDEDAVQEIMRNHWVQPKRRSAQKKLAAEVTELVHGASGFLRALTATEILHGSPDYMSLAADDIVAALSGDARLHTVKWREVKGVPISKLAVTYGLVPARAHATRLIASKSFNINNRTVSDPRDELHLQHLVQRRVAILRGGRAGFLILHVEDGPSVPGPNQKPKPKE